MVEFKKLKKELQENQLIKLFKLSMAV